MLQHLLVHTVDCDGKLRRGILVISVGQNDTVVRLQISQIENAVGLQVTEGLFLGGTSGVLYLLRAGAGELCIIDPALRRRKGRRFHGIAGCLFHEKFPFDSQILHHFILQRKACLFGTFRKIIPYRCHISEGQRYIALIQANVPALCNLGKERILIGIRFAEHILYIQKGLCQCRSAIVAIVYLAVAHSPSGIQVHHIGVQCGGKDTGSRIPCQGTVILCLTGEFLHTIELVLPLSRHLI